MNAGSAPSMREALLASPVLYPYDLDTARQAGHFFQFTEADYASASFLDHRALRSGMANGPIPWPVVQQAAGELTADCDFIFHISHCGSTLLSRLLGLMPGCFSLREPALLRKVGAGQSTECTDVLLKLYSRTFAPQQRALIKATSFVSEQAALLLDRVAGSRALMLYVPLSTFLSALLDGAMSDITSLLESRLSRLIARGLISTAAKKSLSSGEAVALSWLTEMLALSQAAQAFPERCKWLNFDEYLANPSEHLSQVLSHFGLDGDAAALLQSPLVARYSKRIDVAYTGDFRQQLLTSSRQKFEDEIERGMRVLDRDDVRQALTKLPAEVFRIDRTN